MSHKIMVIEDDARLRALLMSALEDEGYEVREAADAEGALKLARTHRFDLVIADVRLGEVDGLECLARLRRTLPEARSIVMTGYASDEAPTRAVQVRAEDYLHKPFRLDDLLAAVERVLESRQEGERYHRLLAPLMAGCQRLLDQAQAALISADLASLQGPRDRAFQAFFVGVRSRKLSEDGARAIWAQLEQIENRRQELMKEAPQLGRARPLVEGYRYVADLVTAFSRTSLPAQPQKGAVPLRAFAHLYGQVLSGAVSPEQLKQAAVVRALDPLVLSQSEALLRLHDLLWGDGTRE